MKSLFVFTVFCLSLASGIAQNLEFFPNEVRGLDKTFVLKGNAGQSTVAKSLSLYNRSGKTLRIYARPHMEADALYFTDASGKTSRDYSLQLAPGASGTLQLFGYIDSATRNCSGYLALAATPQYGDNQKGETRTVKLPVVVSFAAPQTRSSSKPAASAIEKPDRYEAVMNKGLPMRRHLKHLPLKVYSDHIQTGDTAAYYSAVVQRVVVVWNKVGRDNGLDRDFFRVVKQSKGADIRINWTGRYLLPSSEGTAYPSEGRIGMMPLGHYRGLGRAGETLMQELCHMLGVAHSEVQKDIMFMGAHAHNLDLSELSVTARDKQMLGWLYSQTRYTPLKE